MLVLEYKIKASKNQYKAIDEAIRTVQFVRNKCLRYWMDASKDSNTNYAVLSNYSTELRKEFDFVKSINSMAVQASAERTWLAISRFFGNCKSNKPGKKGYPKFQKDNRSVEYKTSGWSLHPTKRRIAITDKKGWDFALQLKSAIFSLFNLMFEKYWATRSRNDRHQSPPAWTNTNFRKYCYTRMYSSIFGNWDNRKSNPPAWVLAALAATYSR